MGDGSREDCFTLERFTPSRILTFVAVAVLSALLLLLFPFFPLQILVVLALVLGAIGLEVPSVGLLLAILLSLFGALFQNQFLGLTFLIVFVVLVAVTTTWVEAALLATSWILAFLVTPALAALAILPTILAGLHVGRQDAFKIGALSGFTIFLLSWAQGISQAGLMLVPFPTRGYVAKPIPEPWQFTAFIPGADFLDPNKLSAYFAPLASNIGDFRIYALIAGWAVTGYLVGILAAKLKGYSFLGAAVIGTLPAAVVAAVFAQTSVLQIGAALVGALALAVAYMYLTPLISAPRAGVFSTLNDLTATGIPQKYSLLLGSPVCDERNLIIDQFLQSGGLKQKTKAFLVTADINYARSMATKLGDSLTVLVPNLRATSFTEKNMIAIPSGVQNLTTLSIELVNAVKSSVGSGARVCLDVLSDMILFNKILTTRKWVTDLMPRLEGWEFTVLGVFNPVLHSKEDIGGLLDLFKGYVEVFDKDYAGRTRKHIAVRKMTDLQYNENELLLDKEQLLRQRKTKGGFAGILSRR